jgi:histidinol-phosphate aminotransferase
MNEQQINLQYTTIKTPLPDFIYDGLRDYSAGANLYRPQPEVLIEKLATKHHLPKEMIFLTAGIDEAIQMFAESYGSHAYTFTPTYIVYGDVEEFGGKLTRIPSVHNGHFAIQTDTIPDATLIYAANPNNPAGYTTKEAIMPLVKNNPQAKVVIDEAYAEFADVSVIDEVINHPNTAVFRSFSKGYGMAGNRLGFIVASPEIIAIVKNKTQWANVSYLSVGAAIIALDHEDHFHTIREDIIKRRSTFERFLIQKSFTVIPSKINAVLLQFSDESSATHFVQYLASHNIIVSHGNGTSNMGLDKSFVRLSIGTHEQMSAVQEVIDHYSHT